MPLVHFHLSQVPLCVFNNPYFKDTSLLKGTLIWPNDTVSGLDVVPLYINVVLLQVKCRDCLKETESSFHVVGLKCGECGSYNTVRCGNEEIPEDEGGQEGAVGGGVGVVPFLEMWRIIQNARRRLAGQDREAGEGEEGEVGEDEESTHDVERYICVHCITSKLYYLINHVAYILLTESVYNVLCNAVRVSLTQEMTFNPTTNTQY